MMQKKNKRVLARHSGMTLVELLIASGILVFAITGILIGYLRCLELNEISWNTSQSVKAAASRLEEIRGTSFDLIKATFHEVSFDVAGVNGKGVSYVDDTDPNLLLVNVCVSWRQKNGRLFGEDADVDGQKDTGEDINNDGILNGPVQLTSYIFEK